MRSPSRMQQKVWFAKITEETIGTSKVPIYEKPIMKRLTVSATSGTPEEIGAGIVPMYDRYITSYDRNFQPEEGMVLWVDRVPELTEDGEIALKEDGYTPVVFPDYTLKKILDTQNGIVARYGIEKRGS